MFGVPIGLSHRVNKSTEMVIASTLFDRPLKLSGIIFDLSTLETLINSFNWFSLCEMIMF